MNDRMVASVSIGRKRDTLTRLTLVTTPHKFPSKHRQFYAQNNEKDLQHVLVGILNAFSSMMFEPSYIFTRINVGPILVLHRRSVVGTAKTKHVRE